MSAHDDPPHNSTCSDYFPRRVRDRAPCGRDHRCRRSSGCRGNAGRRAETPIPSDSLLLLLHAEFALRQRDFDQGLALLSEQAAVLTDPALTRRALRLAEFVNDSEKATAMAVRLVELDPNDGAAAAAASGWLSRTGQPAEALRYAGLALELGHSVNIASSLGTYESLDSDGRAEIAEAIGVLATRWPEDDQVAIAASLLARLEGDFSLAESLIRPVLERSPDDTRAIMLWTADARSVFRFSF